MRNVNHVIFRAEAMQHYLQGKERPALPNLPSPHTFFFLWALLALLAAGTLAAWSARVPVYASGLAVVVDGDGQAQDTLGDHAVLVAFLPPESLPRLRAGQTLFLRSGATGERFRSSILAVEPEVISPSAAQARFGLRADAARALSQPAAVVLARFDPAPACLPPSAYVGTIYRADVQVASRRVLSLVPWIGPLVGG